MVTNETKATEEYIFSDVGGALCLDFANTVSSHLAEQPDEHLNTYDDLLKWARQRGVLSEEDTLTLRMEAERHPQRAEATLRRARELRQSIYRVFAAVAVDQPVPDEAMQVLNGHVSSALANARVIEEESGFRWGWIEDKGDLERVLWPVARSAAELLTSEKRGRVRECGGHDCGWLFVDTSKNKSRRWCDMGDCGNRAKARRHYRKQKAVRSRQ